MSLTQAPEAPHIFQGSGSKLGRLRNPSVEFFSDNKEPSQLAPRAASPLAPVLTLLALLGACALVPGAARAQAVYGSIFGTSTDHSGAAVVGAKLTVTSVQKGTKFEMISNAA